MNDFVTVIEDSRRWRDVELRDDDIIISTPPKSGTTWMQGIVSSLLWPNDDAPGTLSERSPWVDMRARPIDELVETLEAQETRRFIKTHSGADAIPFASSIRYITVYRDAPDALVSWGHHRAKMRTEIMEVLNALAVDDDLDPLPLSFDGDYDVLFEEWSQFCSPARHLASWWPLRDRSNVLMLHYADLWADLDREMQRIADFLEIEISARAWPGVVEACRIDVMRSVADRTGMAERAFEGGAASFFRQGGNGDGARQLDRAQLDRIAEHCAAHLDADAVEWLASGGAV